MRCLIATSLVVVGLAGQILALPSAHDDASVPRRKSLGFGPAHPHSVFHSSPHQISTNGFVPLHDDAEPFEVAQHFMNDLLKDQAEGLSYYVRSDSYTDKNTGVTHIYARQLANGVEVADGDMNINVKDGMVISYGSSFYKGSAPSALSPPVSDSLVHAEFCSQLSDELAERQVRLMELLGEDQTVMADSHAALKGSIMGPVEHLYDWNCAHVDTPATFMSGSDADMFDARKPLLQFMIAATPNSNVVQDILSRYDEHLEKMTSTFESSLVAGRQSLVEHISNVPDTVNPVKARFAFHQVSAHCGTVLVPVWKYEVEMEDNWYEASVSASAPHRIISVIDWASDAPVPHKPSEHVTPTYNVFAWGVNDPSVGNRTIVKGGADKIASPEGWHAIPLANDPQSEDFGKPVKAAGKWRNTTTTWGINVFAHENWEGRNNWIDNYRPDAGETLVFDYPYNPKSTDRDDALDEAQKYINVSVTELFYTSNLVHDLYYRYGFDEVSGNFQQYNYGRGGAENDAVIANAQDGSGYNNANFMTPPDGQNGRCRMYVWNTANPYRDGDLEAGIVIHELSHGLSTRLTGGPANSGCLGWGESGGMGEGWGDFLATTIRSIKQYSDYPMGAWAANREDGIRNYPYSLNDTVNPSTYKTLDQPGYWGVHAIGEVWAQILWVVSQRLIEKYGYIDTLFPPQPLDDGTIPEGDFYRPREYTASGIPKPLVPKHGNSLIVQLVINGMKLQPCRPSFFEARDAIIQADQILTGGENFCDLWTGFASRGLGPDADIVGSTPWGGGVRTNDFQLPLVCRAEDTPEEP